MLLAVNSHSCIRLLPIIPTHTLTIETYIYAKVPQKTYKSPIITG